MALVTGATTATSPGLAAQAPTARELVLQLGSTKHRERSRAFQILQRTRPPEAVPLLCKALPGYPLASQSLGFAALRRYPSATVLPQMEKLLAGKASYCAVEAGVWLMSRRRPEAERRIARALREPASGQELNLMLGSVGHLDSPVIVTAALEHLRADLPRHLIQSILRVALRTRHTPAISRVQALRRADGLGDGVGVLLDGFLLAMGDASVVDTLAAAIPNEKTLASVQEFLRHVPKPVPRKILAAVLEFVEGKKGHVARVGLEILIAHEYAPTVRVLRGLIDSDDDVLAKTAFDGLLKLNSGMQPRALKGLLGSKNEKLVIAAADALRRQDDLSGLPQVLALAAGNGKAVAEAVDALGKFRSRKAGPVLIAALEHSDRRVRVAAYRGVQRLIRGLFPYRRFDFAAAGYQAQGPLASRRAAVSRLRHWWQTVGESRK